MRVLIISHNVISESNNMGKTLLSYFSDFLPDELAEFYIQDAEPSNALVCKNYYRITDREALASIFVGGKGKVCCPATIETGSKKRLGYESVRQYGRRRNSLVYYIRNFVWGVSRWRTKSLLSWLNEFNPDVIFFMAGDYSFMFKIVLDIQEFVQKPLVVCCTDDHFIFNRNETSCFGRAQHRSYMSVVNKTMKKASCILTISDSMSKAYSQLFSKPCYTIHTGAKKRECHKDSEGSRVAYFGNLSFGRFEQLVEVGKAVKRLGLSGLDGIDVYSSEKKARYLVGLTEENGIYFHGEIPPAEVYKRMDDCLAVIHTESFDQKNQNMVRYSVSTKIADSLLNGPCVIAYGPEGVASIDYLKVNNAAYVITKPELLEKGLREILTDEKLRKTIKLNARRLGEQNHNSSNSSARLRDLLCSFVNYARS